MSGLTQEEQVLLEKEPEQLVQETQSSEPEPLTQVTSIAKEEERTGEKVPLPSPEELVQRAAIGLTQNLLILQSILNSGKLSSKAKNRVLIAILSLPTDKIPVKLKSEEEKMAFVYGQRAINDRFLVTQYYIGQEMNRRKEELASQAAQAQQALPTSDSTPLSLSLPVDPNANTVPYATNSDVVQVSETKQGENNE